jgi:hypothetical protein
MRKNSEKQMPLMPPKIDHPQAEELNAISCILDRNPIIYDLAMQDLSCSVKKSKAGAKGMTAEQVVRAAIVKQMFEFSYKDLAFHLIDSVSLRRFCFIGIADNKRHGGRPLKVRSREKTPPRRKKIPFFRLTIDGFLKSPYMHTDTVLQLSRTFYESINFTQQHDLALASFRIRYFFFIGFRSHRHVMGDVNAERA